MLKIHIIDINHLFVQAARHLLTGRADVEINVTLGNITLARADADVSPANSFGFMDGGADAALKAHFPGIEATVREAIRTLPFHELLVGQAICVPTGGEAVPNLIVAPTMRVPTQITDPTDVMLATRAAVRLAREEGFRSLAMTGLGTGTGRVPAHVAAMAMLGGIKAGLLGVQLPATLQDAATAHGGLTG